MSAERATRLLDGTHASKIYVGSTKTSFKQRYANHLMSFRHEKYGNRKELSKYIWGLKHEGKNSHVSWDILRKAPAYTNLSKRCDLCVTEKLMNIPADKSTLLNKCSQIISKCRHQNKVYQSNFVGGLPSNNKHIQYPLIHLISVGRVTQQN